MSYTYPKTISEDFAALTETFPDGHSLKIAIDAAISTAVVDGVNCSGDTCDIIFDSEPSVGDKAATDVEVTAHTGVTPYDKPAGLPDGASSAKDRDLTDPPGGPVKRDRYIIATPATGAWAGRENGIAEWNGTKWIFTTPHEGLRCWLDDENLFCTFDGAAWLQIAGAGEANTASNVGAGAGVFKEKIGVDLRLRSLVGLGDIDAAVPDDEVEDTIEIDGTNLLPRDGARAMTGDLAMGNKDITGAQSITFGAAPDADAAPGATPEIDWSTGPMKEITLDATVTGITFVAPPGIGDLILVVKQPGGANHPIEAGAWIAAVKWPAETAPTITAANGALDKLRFYYDGTYYIADFTQDHK